MKYLLLFFLVTTVWGIVDEIRIRVITKKYSKGWTYRGLKDAFTYKKGKDGNYYLMD